MGGLGGRHPGAVGITAGMGIITYILCNVSRLCSCSCRRLTIGPDIWYKRWGNDLRLGSLGWEIPWTGKSERLPSIRWRLGRTMGRSRSRSALRWLGCYRGIS